MTRPCRYAERSRAQAWCCVSRHDRDGALSGQPLLRASFEAAAQGRVTRLRGRRTDHGVTAVDGGR